MRSGAEYTTCGVMSVLEEFRVLEHFRFLITDAQPVKYVSVNFMVHVAAVTLFRKLF